MTNKTNKFETTLGYIIVCLACILFLTFFFIFAIPNSNVLANKPDLKMGDVIILPLGKPIVVKKNNYHKAIFTFTGKISKYYSVDYQACSGEGGTGKSALCAPHKIVLTDKAIIIDMFSLEIENYYPGDKQILVLKFNGYDK